MKKPPVVFALGRDGVLYVKLAAVMAPLCALVDGLPLTFFGKGKTAYLTVERAIEWCREEMKYHDRQKYQNMIGNMERALAQPR